MFGLTQVYRLGIFLTDQSGHPFRQCTRPRVFQTFRTVCPEVRPPPKEIASTTVVRKNDMPLLDQSSVPHSAEISPVIYKNNIPSTQRIDFPTKRNATTKPYDARPLQVIRASIDPIVTNDVRTQFTETRSKYTTTPPIADQMDDADLLNPRTSLLSDAVRLLDSAVPRLKAEVPRYVAPGILRYAAPYTFPLPTHAYQRPLHPSNIVTEYSGRHNLLPYRDDVASSSISLSPPDNEMELARFDTNIGRFANGVANR
ncbi:hypothetical protein KIN20_006939 [Parelaphostrongylus tenuis]|uniref:Uncharacterized protein n=1 Tax=Parelaphostrongylus tenuis TaxID=148309 RepID=A0AAD5ML69_PARTN|nr:hypothetical protein KIN20_006939 [Parelaphostrongylus tenuis]